MVKKDLQSEFLRDCKTKYKKKEKEGLSGTKAQKVEESDKGSNEKNNVRHRGDKKAGEKTEKVE